MAQSDQGDLNDLIDAAAKQASRRPTGPVREQAVRTSGASSKGLAIAAVAGAVVLVGFLWAKLAPPGSSQVERDLDSAVELARQSVESARKSSGTLPQALPNASLAAVVGYEQAPDGYRLVASMMGIRVILERDGTKKVEKR